MFGFLKKTAAAPKAKTAAKPVPEPEAEAGPATPRTPELDRKFADRPTNANVAALVHLYMGTRLLELLVRRGVINFGEGVTKSDEATALAKANLSFINELTTAHAKHATDFEEFRVGIQDRASETTRKLAALLRAADQRVGSPDSELAEGLPWPAKTQIAIALDGLAALFGVDNPEADACKRMRADATPMEEEAHKAFVDELLDAIARGNGAKAYAFIRMAGYSLAHLAATPDGRSAIAERIAKSIAEHGALDSSLMRFDDVPDDIEKEFENPNALFSKETVGLERRAAAYAAVAGAMVGWMRGTLAANAEVAVALASAGVAAADDAAEDAKADLQFDLLAKQLAEAGAPIVDAGGKVESAAALAPLRDAMKTTAAALVAAAKAADLGLKDGEDAKAVGVARYFAGVAASTLSAAAAKGEAELNDRPIPHAEARPAGFEAAVEALGAAADDASDKLKSDYALAENMLAYFAHHAHAAAKG